MTNSKLVKVDNLPWNPHGNRPNEMHLYVLHGWVLAEKRAEFHRRAYKDKTVSLGFADWLLTQGATDAVAEDWSIA